MSETLRRYGIHCWMYDKSALQAALRGKGQAQRSAFLKLAKDRITRFLKSEKPSYRGSTLKLMARELGVADPALLLYEMLEHIEPLLEDRGNGQMQRSSTQDETLLDAKGFTKLVYVLALQEHALTDQKPGDAQGIWDDNFSAPGEPCGASRLNWTGSWSGFRAFFDRATSAGLFITDKGIGEFFADHFTYQGEPRSPREVTNGARTPTTEHERTAAQIVQGILRIVQPTRVDTPPDV